MAASGFSGCALFQPEKPTLRMTYEAPANDSTGLMRVFSMNGNTVLQFFDVGASNPTIYVDGSSAPSTYQVVGQQLAIVGGHHREIRVTTEHGDVVVHSLPSPAASSASAAAPAPVASQASRGTQMKSSPTLPASPAAGATPDLALARAELAAVQRELIAIRNTLHTQETGGGGPSPAQVSEKLDELESRVERAAQTIWRFSFESGSAAFTPAPGVAAQLLKEASSALSINVRGRTDSEVADAVNTRIAAARARAARDYLVDHGIAAQKIRVFSLGGGAFIADNRTEAGRTANRRVEIEMIHGS